MNTLRLAATLSLSLALTACAAGIDAGGDSAFTEEAVVGGSLEPNYKFPWEVSLNGCHGVLIDPAWVLTAAHCVQYNGWGRAVLYSRTDPYDRSVHADRRTALNAGAVHIHPGYLLGGGFSDTYNDIALVHLDSPFVIDSYIQTVGLPTTPSAAGITGAVASGSTTAGYDLVMRTQIPSTNPSTCAPPAGAFCLSSSTASLCYGDSGSGFVSLEGGRAIVRGIASYINSASSCQVVGPSDYVGTTDVYSYRDWILSTMGRNALTIDGNVRVHAAGRLARGVVGLGCTNPYGTMYAPINVAGTQVGANCATNERQSVVCQVPAGQTDPIYAGTLVITGFTMKQTTALGTTTTALPIGSSDFASYYGWFADGATREFTCTVGFSRVVLGGGGGVTAL